MSVWGPVYISSLAGGADGVAEALCVTPHPPQTAAGEQTFYGKLHGDPNREMDELPLPRESGEWLCGVCMLKSGSVSRKHLRHCGRVKVHFLVGPHNLVPICDFYHSHHVYLPCSVTH